MAQRKGWLHVELLIAMVLVVMILAVAVSALTRGQKFFERQQNLSETEVQASRTLAFIESMVLSAGMGLPFTWEPDLFILDSYVTPSQWRSWHQNLRVSQIDSGGALLSQPAGEWGNVLQILSAAPLEGVVTVESKELDPQQWTDLRLSLSIHNRDATGNKAGDWLLFPGLTVPARMMASQQAVRLVKVKTSQSVTVPLAQPVYRLVALDLRHDQLTVTGDFLDGAGRQPLFRQVEKLSFRLNEDSTVLDVKVKYVNGMIREKSWRLRH